MEQALRQAKKYSILVSPHCELSPWAVQYCRKLRWLTEFPTNDYTQEPFFIKRDIELAKKTDSKIHISHVSMEESVIEIARAKRDGVQVTCEATPHHLILDSSAEELYGLNVKVNPPLRSSYDIRALRDGLRDGTIDVLASDHAPHLSKSPDSSGRLKKVYPLPIERDDVAGAKNNRVNVPIYRDSHFEDWNKAPFGLVGLETTLGLILTYLVAPGVITLQDAIAKMTVNPARIFNLPTGELKIGMPADITIIDLAKEWRVDVDKFKSKSRNSPFHNWKLKGKAVATIARGKIVMQNDKIL